MIGELAGLASAFMWAASSVALTSQSGRLSVITLNAARLASVSFFFIAVLGVWGRLPEVAGLPPTAMIALLVSVLLGIMIGDTLYFRSMMLIGVSRAFPLSGSYPLFTMLIALLFLDEAVTLPIALGIIVLVVGVWLVALPSRGKMHTHEAFSREVLLRGSLLALAAAILWAISTAALKIGLASADSLVANSFRIPIAAIILSAVALRRGGWGEVRRAGRRGMLIVAVAGILGSGVGGTAFLLSVQLAGAAKAAALSSTSPIFAAPLAALFLGERLSWRLAVGTIACVVGIWLLT